jgi:hypothetical protein
MGSPPVAAAASWRGWLVVKCTVFGMMAVNCEGFKLLSLQMCSYTTISSDVQLDVQLHNNFFRCAAATVSSDVVQHNNFFSCAATKISSDVQN